MKPLPLVFAAGLLAVVFFGGVVSVQAQHVGVCDIDCVDPSIRPSGSPAQQGQVPTTRGLPRQQRGLGGVSSPAVSSGNATTVLGSSSYTYTVPIRFAAPGRGPDPSL